MKKKGRRAFKFAALLILTVFLSRLITRYINPEPIIFGYELHHFYYGLFMLIVLNLTMLFGKKHPKIYFTLSALSLGLIADELLFVLGGFHNEYYSSTIPHAFYTTLCLVGILAIIIHDFHPKINSSVVNNERGS